MCFELRPKKGNSAPETTIPLQSPFRTLRSARYPYLILAGPFFEVSSAACGRNQSRDERFYWPRAFSRQLSADSFGVIFFRIYPQTRTFSRTSPKIACGLHAYASAGPRSMRQVRITWTNSRYVGQVLLLPFASVAG